MRNPSTIIFIFIALILVAVIGSTVFVREIEQVQDYRSPSGEMIIYTSRELVSSQSNTTDESAETEKEQDAAEATPDTFRFSFFRFSPTLSNSDQLVREFDVPQAEFIGLKPAIRENQRLLVTKDSVELVSVSTDEREVLLSAEENRMIVDAELFENETGAVFAYISAARHTDFVTDDFRLFVEENGETHEFVLSEDVSRSAFWITDYSSAASAVYVSTGFGDAGFLSTTTFAIDLETGERIEVSSYSTESETEGALLNPELSFGMISPDGNYRAFVRQRVRYQPWHLAPFAGETPDCLTNLYSQYADAGEDVFVENIETGEVIRVFKNRDFENNLCQNLMRTIDDLAWHNGEINELVIATPSGIAEISEADFEFTETEEAAGEGAEEDPAEAEDVAAEDSAEKTAESEEAFENPDYAYEFPRTGDPRAIPPHDIVMVKGEYIFLKNPLVFGAASIVDLSTGKVMEVPRDILEI